MQPAPYGEHERAPTTPTARRPSSPARLSHGGRATAEDRRSPSAAAGIARRSARASLRELSRRAVGQRLGHMLLVDGLGVRKRRNCPRHARHPRPAAARAAAARPLCREAPSQHLFAPAGDPQGGGGPQPRDRRRRSKARRGSAELGSARSRQRDDEVEAVEQRSRASPERPPAAEPSTGNPRRRRRAPAGHMFMLATSWNRAGKTALPPSATAISPSSSGWRSASSTGRWNSGSSSRKSTP